jgi:hypothetical protein
MILALRRLRQEDQEFKASVGYKASPSLKNTHTKMENIAIMNIYASKISMLVKQKPKDIRRNTKTIN